VRAAYRLVPGLAEPDGNAYTPDQRAQIRAMTIRNFGNAAVSDEINRTGIGPQGYGGTITALDVHVEMMPCHIASLPVAVNIQCHAHRIKEVTL
jgi:tartrate dehydratase alpha subunit/fumarate hydratase class I-like protein